MSITRWDVCDDADTHDSSTETFEGLGLGARLAQLKLSPRYHYVPIVAALCYGITTPIGIAAGLGARETYNPGSTTASIVSGVMDALSAGILLYTGLVEVCTSSLTLKNDRDVDVASFIV